MQESVLEISREAYQHLGALKQLEELLKTQRSRKEALSTEYNVAKASHTLLEKYADKERDALQTKIESIVTYGLKAVFGADYEFKLEQVVSRGIVTYSFFLEYQGHRTNLVEAHGGGILAVVGYLLRVVVILLSGGRRLVILDETFAHVSRQHLPAVVELVRTLADKLEFQHIIVTHQPEFEETADVIYRVRLGSDGTSEVALI